MVSGQQPNRNLEPLGLDRLGGIAQRVIHRDVGVEGRGMIWGFNRQRGQILGGKEGWQERLDRRLKEVLG